LTSQLVCYCLC